MRRVLISVAIAGLLGWVASTAAPRDGGTVRHSVSTPMPTPTPVASVAVRTIRH